MEKADLELIIELKAKNGHLDRLWNDHLELEKKISKLESTSPGVVDTKEIHELKKLKLRGRDEIEKILQKHRLQS